jgi:hypothetical protein
VVGKYEGMCGDAEPRRSRSMKREIWLRGVRYL